MVALASLLHCKLKDIGRDETHRPFLYIAAMPSQRVTHHRPRPRRFPLVNTQKPHRAVDGRRPHRSRRRLLRGVSQTAIVSLASFTRLHWSYDFTRLHWSYDEVDTWEGADCQHGSTAHR
jgi:hypothetical protein